MAAQSTADVVKTMQADDSENPMLIQDSNSGLQLEQDRDKLPYNSSGSENVKHIGTVSLQRRIDEETSLSKPCDIGEHLSDEKTPSQPTELENAYFARIVDGEGCISIVRESLRRGSNIPVYRISFTVKMSSVNGTDKDKAIWRMKELYGGRIDPIRPTTRSWAPQSQWGVNNDEAIRVLKLLYPYLIVKKKQAALAFKFRELIKQTYRTKDAHRLALREKLAMEMNELNKVGGVETVREALSEEMIQSELHGDMQKESDNALL